MTLLHPSLRFQRSLLSLALASAFIPWQAHAEGDEAKAVGTISVGLGGVSGSSADRTLFGQYNGLRDKDAFGILGIDYSLRNQEAGNWVDFQATNLGLETREMHLIWKNPGSWKITADYGELVHYDPYTINTGLVGSGSTTPQVQVLAGGPGSGGELELKTKRTGLGFGFSKTISPAFSFTLDLKNEKKEGSRLFGTGMNCPTAIDPKCGGTTATNTGWALLMLPEPISANHSQVEARLNYAIEKFRVNLGYYGSFYRNDNGSLNPLVPGSLNNPLGALLPLSSGLQSLLASPLALAPDNQSQQFDLNGSYDFTHSTRATMKLAYSTATQTDNFAGAGLANAPVGVSNLDGKVQTKLAKIGLTSRPMSKLSLLADLRYENKDDQTPIAYYNTEGTASYTNRAQSMRKTLGKLEAGWQFNSDYRGTLTADHESIDRGVFTATSATSGISALREQTDETAVRAELRRRMAENFSGSISLSSSRRDGSNWLKPNSGQGVTEVTNLSDPVTGLPSTAIFMPTLANRKRDKAKLFADWQASESLALQFSVEGGKDKFDVPSSYGLQDTRMDQYTVDWNYALSDKWGLNGYLSLGHQNLNQARPAGAVMAFDNTNTGANIGFTGKPSGTVEVGGNLSYVDDKSVYAQTLTPSAGADSVALLAATGGLPDIVFNQTTLKLFGKYALDKTSAIRVDFVYQRSNWNDWAWGYNNVPFTYSDGTTVVQKPTQSVSAIGISYVYQLP